MTSILVLKRMQPVKAEKINVNPLYFMVPAATACGYSFCLPVGTPPNAIVYSAANMKPGDMVSLFFNSGCKSLGK